MSSKDSYHVLLSCASRSDADYFSNLLRAHADGAAIRTREVGTLPELRERLADPTWEVLVATGMLDAAVMPLPWTVAKTFYAFLAGGEFVVHV